MQRSKSILFALLLLVSSLLLGVWFVTFINKNNPRNNSTQSTSTDTNEFILKIDRIFMHSAGEYSVAYVDTNQVIVVIDLNPVSSKYNSILYREGALYKWAESHKYIGGLQLSTTVQKATVISDVPESKPMYFRATGQPGYLIFETHIHSVKDINGAGWRSGGKHPVQGETTVIE